MKSLYFTEFDSRVYSMVTTYMNAIRGLALSKCAHSLWYQSASTLVEIHPIQPLNPYFSLFVASEHMYRGHEVLANNKAKEEEVCGAQQG